MPMLSAFSILVIDNTPEVWCAVSDIFRKEAYLYHISRAEASMAFIRTCSPQVIICNLQLPDASALQICQNSKKLNHVPFCLLVSSTFDPDEKRLALAAGSDAYLTLPFDEELLKTKVRLAVQRYGINQYLDSILTTQS